ncbi:MAG TPA: metal ABC transporter permease [Burkholderiales bacterium]|nr:metal ABC transporter permease [Burkholderiales bacterium]
MTTLTAETGASWSFLGQLLLAALIGAASGAIGSFILLRRMALVGDALSHVALPGIALALAYRVDPFWGVIGTLLAAAVLVNWLEAKSELSTDALVGLLFTASLAVGILAIPDAEILESLFGAFPALSPLESAATAGSAALMLAGTFLFARRFLFRIVSEDLAQSSGVGRGYDLLLLVVFSSVVALGIKLVGTLLMGALTIIPAAIARNVSSGMRRYLLIAVAIGALISVIGVSAAALWALRPGPTVVLVGVACFVASLPVARRTR